MTFGNIRTTQKVTNKDQKFDCMLHEHFTANQDYYLFVVNEVLHKVYLDLLIKDIEKSNIKSYLIVSAITTGTPKDDSTIALLSVESNWRNYITFNNTRSKCIIAFGDVIRILNKSADINFYDFIDDKFNPPRYFCGSEFVKGPDLWIYPVANVKDIYPVTLGNDYTCMYTSFFREILKRIKTDNMSTDELDMRDYVIHSDFIEKEQVNEALKGLLNSELLAIDTETDGFHFIRNKLYTIQLSNDGVNGYIFKWNLVDKRLLKQVLKTAKRITLANAKFDVRFIWQNGVRDWFPTDDTVLLSHAINSNRNKGLKPSAIFYCGKFTGYDLELDEAKKRLKVDNYTQIPKRIFDKYAGLDPIVTWRLQVALDKHCHWIDKNIPNEKIPEWTIWKWYKDVMIPNANVVTEIEIEGIYFNKKQFEVAGKRIGDKIAKLKKELASLWNVPETFEFESTQKLGRLFKELGWPELEQSKSGDYKTSEVVLTEYERLNKPGIKILKELRSWNVARGTFIEGWRNWLIDHPDGTSRIHPNCNTFGALSYRHAMRDPNFQQVPSSSTIAKEVKKLFTVPELNTYKVTDENGNIWEGKASDLIKTQRGEIKFDELKENDSISMV